MILITAVIVLLFSLYMALQVSVVQTYLAQIITRRLSEQFHADISVKGVDIAFFNKVILEEVLIKDQQKDSMILVGKLVAQIDSFSIRNRSIALKKLILNDSHVRISMDSTRKANYRFLFDTTATTSSDTIQLWNVSCSGFALENASFSYTDNYAAEKKQFQLYDIFLNISGFHLNNDSTYFHIDELSLTDRKNFSLTEFNSGFVLAGDQLKLTELYAGMPHSVVSEAHIFIDKSKVRETGNYTQMKLDIHLNRSRVSMLDIAQLVPSLRGMDADIEVSGRVYGSLSDLKARDLLISYGDYTNINCDFYMNGLPSVENTFVHLDLKRSTTHFRDLGQFRLPDIAMRRYIRFPTVLFGAGIIEYQGSFTGFVSDFVAYGTIKSNFGRLNTDLAFKPSGTDEVEIDGHLKTVEFKVGEFLKNDIIGNLTYNGKVSGKYNKKDHILTANIDGGIERLDLNNYELTNVELKGNISGKRFDGHMSVADENLNLDFDGVFDFNPEVPVFDFVLNLDRGNLIALNLDKKYRVSELSFLMKANFTGSNIDNLAGAIWLEDGSYHNENGAIGLKSFDLKTFNDSISDRMQLRSDYLDADFQGEYTFYDLKNSVLKIVSRFLPSTNLEYNAGKSKNIFQFSGKLKNSSTVTNVFFPGLLIEPSEFKGRVNSETDQLSLTARMPEIQYKGTVMKNVWIDFSADREISMKNRFDEIHIGGNYRIHNLSLVSAGGNDKITTKISWGNFHERTYSGSLNAFVKFREENDNGIHFVADIQPSRVYIADSLWFVNPAKVFVDDKEVRIDNLNISSKKQQMYANGYLSESKDKQLSLKFENIDLRNLNDLVQANLNIEGVLSGEAAVFSAYENAYFLSDLKISGFGLRKHLFGDVSMVNKWDGISEVIDSEVIVSKNNRNTLQARGSYSPTGNKLDYTIDANGLSVTVLQPFMEGSFSDFRGEAFGKIRLHGHPSRILLDGGLYGKNAGLTLSYLQTAYTFSDTVRFAGDSIIFDHIVVNDADGNTAVFDGSIRHENFEHMVYDLNFTTPRILAINTNSGDNERFYGKLYASGSLAITGLGLNVYLNAAGRTEQGTELNILLDYEEQAKEYDFLTFIDRQFSDDKKETRPNIREESNVNMNFEVEVTPEARAQLIYNSQIGDVIRSYGYGNLQIGIDKDFNIVMYGDYTVSRGDYLFTLQNVINKKFEIERGGTIVWNGDPYDATIHLNAVYHLKASLKELFPTSDTEIDYNQRVPVNCKITMTDNLNNPSIGFDIDFPSSEDRVKDEVRQFFNTEEDRNKQILSLLILGRFYTPEYLRGSYEASNSNVVGSTASELFSNQLSNWLSKISSDFDIGVNYRPGNQVTDDEVELALSTQIFNDRVTINGNIGNNVSQTTSSNNNSNIVGDFDLNVKLNKSGKLHFKAFNHSNNNLIYETSPYTQGIGLSYREDYDNLGELWAKIKSILSSGKKDGK
ncbi:MAG: translocation/assembly module TamB domain-containing protein [Prolixibacteraceae bacterium]|nr:translocation/assembly module TamB domain-containing protein [Prolixibacteraceae bacterium]